jgi:group I intron endonuclease
MLTMIGIYKITNPNGKIYVGQSVNIENRFNQYRFISNSVKQKRLYNSFKKHGICNHDFQIIEECTIDLLNERERHWQEHYNCLDGLNCRYQNYDDKKGFISLETRMNISKNRKGIKPNYKDNAARSKKISEALTGKKLSKEHRMSLSIAQTGLKRSPEAIMKSAKSRTGIKMSDEFKIKMSKVQSGGNNSFAKQLLNTETGIFYDTLKEAAESLGWTYNKLNHYINGRTKRKLSFMRI